MAIDHHDRVSCFGERFSWFRCVFGELGGIALIRPARGSTN